MAESESRPCRYVQDDGIDTTERESGQEPETLLGTFREEGGRLVRGPKPPPCEVRFVLAGVGRAEVPGNEDVKYARARFDAGSIAPLRFRADDRIS